MNQSVYQKLQINHIQLVYRTIGYDIIHTRFDPDKSTSNKRIRATITAFHKDLPMKMEKREYSHDCIDIGVIVEEEENSI